METPSHYRVKVIFAPFQETHKKCRRESIMKYSPQNHLYWWFRKMQNTNAIIREGTEAWFWRFPTSMGSHLPVYLVHILWILFHFYTYGGKWAGYKGIDLGIFGMGAHQEKLEKMTSVAIDPAKSNIFHILKSIFWKNWK